MSDITYNDVIQTVLRYYDSNSDFWARVNNGTATAAEIYDAYSRVPQLKLTHTIDGTTIGLDYSQTMSKLAYKEPDNLTDQINQLFSNSQEANFGEGNGYKFDIPSNWSTDGGGGGGFDVNHGAIQSGGSVLATVADRASLAVAGVSLGCKLGVGIDNLLYSADPEWWDNNFPNINPNEWAKVVGQTDTGKFFVRMLFGIDLDKTTAYMPEYALAYTYQMMREKGVFNEAASGTATIADTTGFSTEVINNLPITFGDYSLTYDTTRETVSVTIDSITGTDRFYCVRCKPASGAGPDGPSYIISETPFRLTFKRTITDKTTGQTTSTTNSRQSSSTVFKNKTIYYVNLQYNSPGNVVFSPANNNISSSSFAQISYIVLFGDRTIAPLGPDGMTKDSTGTSPDPTIITGNDIDTILTQLKQNYPQLFDGSISTPVLQDDGTIKDFNYVPVPWPDNQTTTDTNPTTGEATQTDTQVAPDTATKILTQTPTNNPPDTGEGNASPFVMPTGNASSLWAVYHPSQSQLNAFGAWLWSSDFVEQLKRLFNDPMQAIIGVHKVFAPIPTGGSQTIKCGFLDSGVSSPTVSSQYTEVNCGTVNCGEYFGNVFDYDPHTKVSIYLPFIGVVPLKVSEVMRASINVTYGVDVITGACLAKVKVMRDGGGAILYSYGGSCACHYPISSGSYAGIISGIVTSAIGIAGGIVTGNPIATIGGAMAGLHQAHTQVQRSGGFTGCAGAMGPKIPYLIIDRPQTRLASDFAAYQGKPANSTQFIGDCAGFVRATEVHFSAPGVFDEEAREVESLLKAGVKLD